MKENTDKFRLNSLLACMVLSGALSHSVIAQEAAPADENPSEAEIEVIQVEGFRSSLNAALMFKRYSVGTKETIVAEDIGKFPDLNIADSLARVPGIAIEQDAGEGRNIQIRGLGSRFVKTTINGMESAAAGAGTDAAGGSNKTRAFDFNIFASELFTQVDIYKTVSAELEDGGISGNVNLQTASPLAKEGFNGSFNVNARYNDISEETAPRASFMVSNNWDDKFGVLLSVAYSEGIVQSEGASTVRWSDGGSSEGRSRARITATNGFTDEQLNDLYVPRIPRYSIFEKTQERLGVSSSFEYRPNDDLTIKADFLHAKLDTEMNEYQYSALIRSNPDGIDPMTIVVTGDNDIIAGAFTDVDIRSEARQDVSTSEFNQFTLKADWLINDNLKMSAFVGVGRSELEVPHQITFALDSKDSTFAYSWDNSYNPLDLINDGITGNIITGGQNNMEMPSFAFIPGTSPEAGKQYTNSDLASAMTNANAYSLGLARHRKEYIDSENDSIKLDFEYLLNDELILKFGLGKRSFETEYQTFRNDYRHPQVDRDNDGDVEDVSRESFPLYDFLVPAEDKLGSVYGDVLAAFGANFGNAVNIPRGSSLTTATWFAPNYSKLLTDFRNAPYFQPLQEYDRGYRIIEEVSTAYAQLDFEYPLFNSEIRGNIGLRYIDNTNKSYSANRDALSNRGFVIADPSLVLWTESVSESDDVLPSLNIAYDLTDDLVARFSWSEAITRPALSDLSAAVSVNLPSENNPDRYEVEAGAGPNLQPYESTNIDVGLEWYFKEESLLALALFQKDITDLEETSVNTRLTAQQLINYGADPEAIAEIDLNSVTWQVTGLGNAPAVDMWGMELIYQQPFTFLPSPFDGLGIQANYTYIDYEREYENALTEELETLTSVETSEESYNVTVYYEVNNWSARISYNYRDGYAKDYRSNRSSDGIWGQGYESRGLLNFSSRYDINESLTASFEIINLTNEGKIQWSHAPAKKPYEALWNGRQFLIGLRGTF